MHRETYGEKARKVYGRRDSGYEALLPEGESGSDYVLNEGPEVTTAEPSCWITVRGDEDDFICENCGAKKEDHDEYFHCDPEEKMKWQPVQRAFSIRLIRLPEGIEIHVFRKGFEDQDPIGPPDFFSFDE